MASNRFQKLALLLFLAKPALGSDPTPLCFDSTVPVKKPLVPEIQSGGRKDSTAGGKIPSGGEWGAARGQVAKSLDDVYIAILNPYTIKDPAKSKVQLTQENRPGFRAFQTREVSIHLFPLITISWVESWGFVLTEGKDSDPQEMVISYQKTGGTSHISKLCGSIVLRAMGKRVTDVFLYEQMNASHRSSNDIIDGHLGTLRTLRVPSKGGSSH